MATVGLDKEMVDEIKSELTPGTSALLMVGVEGDADEMTRAFDQHNPTKVMRFSLPDDTVQELKEAHANATG